VGLHACHEDSFTFIYEYDVRAQQETHLWASTPVMEIALLSLYIDDVRTSQETHLLASRPFTGIALLFDTYMMYVLHRKHIYGPQRPVMEIGLLFHM
jgi:hypothetical protein